MTPRAEAVRERLMVELRANAGGVMGRDVKRIMHECGYKATNSLESILALLPDDFPVWEEVDEEHDIWYHLLRPGDVQQKRRIAMPEKKTERTKIIQPQVAVSAEVMRKLRHYIADHGGTLKETVEKAILRYVEAA